MGKAERDLIIQARLYRMLSVLLVIIGIILFIILYLQNVEGRLLDALSEPLTVVMILFPFIPAIVLSLMAKSAEKKYLSLKKTKKKKS